MKRRSVLKAAVFGAGAAVAAPALSRGLIEWRMVTSWPKGLPGLGTGAERLAANITAMSGGMSTTAPQGHCPPAAAVEAQRASAAIARSITFQSPTAQATIGSSPTRSGRDSRTCIASAGCGRSPKWL